MTHLRPATISDLQAITALTEEVHAQYLPVLSYPPVPVTEDYAPRVEAGEFWLQETDDTPDINLSGVSTQKSAFRVAADAQSGSVSPKWIPEAKSPFRENRADH